MKIKKSQLRRIIAEEKARLQRRLNETGADVMEVDDAIDAAAEDIAAMWFDQQMALFDEGDVPEIQERNSRESWETQARRGSDSLVSAIKSQIRGAYEDHEQMMQEAAFGGD